MPPSQRDARSPNTRQGNNLAGETKTTLVARRRLRSFCVPTRPPATRCALAGRRRSTPYSCAVKCSRGQILEARRDGSLQTGGPTHAAPFRCGWQEITPAFPGPGSPMPPLLPEATACQRRYAGSWESGHSAPWRRAVGLGVSAGHPVLKQMHSHDRSHTVTCSECRFGSP